ATAGLPRCPVAPTLRPHPRRTPAGPAGAPPPVRTPRRGRASPALVGPAAPARPFAVTLFPTWHPFDSAAGYRILPPASAAPPAPPAAPVPARCRGRWPPPANRPTPSFSTAALAVPTAVPFLGPRRRPVPPRDRGSAQA